MRKEKRIQKFDSTEHQTTNCDGNIVGGEQKSDETTVAVTTQESPDGVREKARLQASMSWGASSSAGRFSSSGGAENDRNKKAGHRRRL